MPYVPVCVRRDVDRGAAQIRQECNDLHWEQSHRRERVSRLNSRLGKIERQLSEQLGPTRCPLCLDGGVGRVKINGEPKLEENDPVYDETWHCRRCGTEATVIHIVTPGLPDEEPYEQSLPVD